GRIVALPHGGEPRYSRLERCGADAHAPFEAGQPIAGPFHRVERAPGVPEQLEVGRPRAAEAVRHVLGGVDGSGDIEPLQPAVPGLAGRVDLRGERLRGSGRAELARVELAHVDLPGRELQD